jgi:flagellar basal body-associated protein FliL
MSKKLLIIIMSVVLGLILIGGGLFVYLTSRNTESGGATIVETLKKLNPFGSSDPLGIRSILDSGSQNNTKFRMKMLKLFSNYPTNVQAVSPLQMFLFLKLLRLEKK